MASLGIVFAIFLAFIGAFVGAFLHKLGFKLFTKIDNVPSFSQRYLIQLVGCGASMIIYSLFSTEYPIGGFLVASLAGIYSMVWLTEKYTKADSKEVLKSLGIIIGLYVVMGFIVIGASIAISNATSQLNLGY